MSWLSPRTRVPVVAIALQGLLAMVIACSGKYRQILSYVVSVDFIFFGLTATCIFIFRRRDAKCPSNQAQYKMPGHPMTTRFSSRSAGWSSPTRSISIPEIAGSGLR